MKRLLIPFILIGWLFSPNEVLALNHFFEEESQTNQDSVLNISTQSECEALSGTWNSCPPNECQKTKEYLRKESICAEICGKPVCGGIVPLEEENLSNVHNPTIRHQTPALDGNEPTINNNPDKLTPKTETPIPPQPTLPQTTKKISTTLGKNIIAGFFFLALIVIIVYLIVASKKR